MKRIVFMGTPHYAREILQGLLEAPDLEVVLVVTQPDRPVGRKKILTPPPVKVLAEERGIRVLQPGRLREEGVREAIEGARPDFIVVAAFGQLLPREILDIAPCINLHASLLPLYRGASPVQQALLNGDRFTGVTAMLMEEGLDSGPMLAWSYLEIDKNMALQRLMAELTRLAAELTPKVLRRFDRIQPLPQFAAAATHCRKIRREDGEITLEDAETTLRKYRAFEGWPGIFLPGGLKLLEIGKVDEENSHRPGEILALEGESMTVGCRRGAIRIATLQPKGKKPMSARAYCVGRGLLRGDSIL
jgi:methionyl-tRNA formyltransferase